MKFSFKRYNEKWRVNWRLQIGYALIFIVLILLAQLFIFNITHVAFYLRIVLNSIVLSILTSLWSNKKSYIAFFCIYTGVFLSAAGVPLLCGQQVGRDEVVDAYLMGASIFFLLTLLLWIVSYIKQKRQAVVRGFIYCILGLCLMMPLCIWGYYIVSGQVLSATIILTLFQTNSDEAISYLRDQNIIAWIGVVLGIFGCIGGSIWSVRNLRAIKFSSSLVILGIMIIYIVGVSVQTMIKATEFLPIRIATETKSALIEYKRYGEARTMREERLRKLQNSNLLTIGGGGVPLYWLLASQKAEIICRPMGILKKQHHGYASQC